MTARQGASPRVAARLAKSEESLRERMASDRPPALSHAEAARLVHELQVHEIELEMQNEELVRVRGELETSLERYTKLFDFAPVGYFTLGHDGAIREVNATAARMVAVERTALLTRRFETLLAGGDRAAFDAMMARARASKDTETCEVTLALPAEADAALRAQLSASVSADGETVRLVVVDVTEQRRAEEQLRGWRQMEAIGRLAGGVAHDFNNLLTIILSYTSLALGAVAKDSVAREHLVDIRGAAESAVELTRQLLAFGRKQVLRPESVDINDLIGGVAKMLRSLLREDVELVLDLGADAGAVEVDPSQMAQVLMNLAVNARDAMPRGGTLTIETRAVAPAPSDAAGATRAALCTRVCVTDTGVGMDEETLARVFEPFFSTKDKERGTGFGLSTVYGIIRQCGGRVSARSELGRGTTFDIVLPCAVSPPGAARVDAAKGVASASGHETLLVVDDEAALRTVVKRILELAGYEVLVAESAAAALEICAERAGAIALVLSDVVMPHMSGVELASVLAERHPDAKVLLMSGYAEDVIEQHGTLDASMFLGKPFTAEALVERVRERLDATSARAASAAG